MTTKRNNKEIRWGYFFLIRRLLQASALLTLLLSTATLQAQVKVLEVRDLKFLPGGDRSEAYDVNNLGQVLGWSNAEFGLCTSGAGGSPQPCRHQGPFLWTEAGGMQQYLSYRTHANAINDFGQVMWSYFFDGNNYTYFEGPDMPEPLELVNSEDVSMNGVDINNRGQVVGDGTRYNPDTGDDYHFLFVWSMDGEQELPVLPGTGYWDRGAFGINDLGQTVGTSKGHAVLWNPVSSRYRIQDLGPGSANAINNLGQIVGESGGQAVLWKPGPSAYKLQTLGTGVAHAINDLGMVVGDSGGHGFVWTATGGMQDLGTLPGFNGSVARAINNLGQVVGSSQALGWDADGNVTVLQSHATRWTLSLPDDTTPPSCAVTGSGTNAAGQRFTKISCQDTGSGLASIHVIKSSNYTAKIPSFSVGTTSPVVVTATKIDNALSAWVTLGLDDIAGNVGFYDPVELEIERTKGKPQSQTLTGLPEAESLITIYNHNPGLTALFIEVNGVKFMIPGLRDNEVRNLDVSPVMAAEDNTMTFQTHGRPGGSATILIHERSDTHHRVRRHANWR